MKLTCCFDPDVSAWVNRPHPLPVRLGPKYSVCVCVTAGRGGDEEPWLPETQEDPGGAEHR